ncbi:STAS domain-containing protein [Streptomyces sp. NPDC020362]|uniref:STAS domain-containing protein n=1 Tax=unclassified Streptomyces TaxID=2593676 RepID=UPI0033DAB18B
MSENHTRVDSYPTDGAAEGPTVVALQGDVDLLAAQTLVDRLDALTAQPRHDLVIDLRQVVFIDCTGLGVLCRTRNRALARRGRLRLVTDSVDFLRLLRTTGLAGVFEVHTRLP